MDVAPSHGSRVADSCRPLRNWTEFVSGGSSHKTRGATFSDPCGPLVYSSLTIGVQSPTGKRQSLHLLLALRAVYFSL